MNRILSKKKIKLIKEKLQIFKLLIAILIFISPFLYFSHSVYMAYRSNNIPQDKMEYTEAVVNSKIYYFNRKYHNKYGFNYKFIVNKKKYNGLIVDKTVNVGDAIQIIYNKDNPNVNRPVVYVYHD